MAIVREKHAQLHEVVGTLSEKISAVLGRQERDFLAAYRAHMYNVQKELHEMREKMQRNETAENKTEKVKKIEEERDWYRKEALRLDAFTANMTKDLKYMKEKLESIEEDRNWLEKQLKACKKQNKLLRAGNTL
jgi:cob(I)alamin adenosyltransferase